MAGRTGGKIHHGICQALKPRKPALRIVAVEPEESPVCRAASIRRRRFRGSAQVSFLISWIVRVIDEIIKVDSTTSLEQPAHSRAAKASRAAFHPCPDRRRARHRQAA